MYFLLLLSLFLSSEAKQTLTENTFIDFLSFALQQIVERDQRYHQQSNTSNPKFPFYTYFTFSNGKEILKAIPFSYKV